MWSRNVNGGRGVGRGGGDSFKHAFCPSQFGWDRLILGFRLIKLVTSKQLADWRTHKVWHFWTDLLSGSLCSRSRDVGVYISIPIHFYSPWSVCLASGVRTKLTHIMYIHYPSIPCFSFFLHKMLQLWTPDSLTDGRTDPSC
jgi:hypothetical protein